MSYCISLCFRQHKEALNVTTEPQKVVMIRWESLTLQVPETLTKVWMVLVVMRRVSYFNSQYSLCCAVLFFLFQIQGVIERYQKENALRDVTKAREDRKLSRFVFAVANRQHLTESISGPSAENIQVRLPNLKTRAKKRMERLRSVERRVPTVIMAEFNDVTLQGYLVPAVQTSYTV